ncbi:hypothetical protein PRIPAC_82506 [Pristionchus pacificus]|uniref:Uncharacterized protein n=1 Tax=Pristionchus pacificus TaxID=54126 RepID=A0A2A6CMV1_PRIPA|nr:hypothetical protein PRIPAC_82506 [Pristionchus pacificus]|eukprot:PDM79426.1 hypothetical protein PRIPAC_32005 [Pristionchus pacificus]
MNSFSLLLASVIVAAVYSMKMTPEIEGCMAQVETRVGSEGDGRVKTAVEQLVANIKSKNLPAAQKVLRENNEADRNMAINKYMVDTCGPMKTCMVCPLELA